ncbi:MAG: hypothetical protein NC115_11790 [Bacteroidales bacterium]|nr:hypothetical protein [Bacteroides sp.]MCM1503328.1 hypothetical protein [Bacteroidales bacterium]
MKRTLISIEQDIKSGKALFIEKVDNCDSFALSRIAIIATENPNFIERLRQYGISQYEIGICCMLLSGLSIKEISIHTQDSRIYHRTSLIRKKIIETPDNRHLVQILRDMY